jgi:hypothetical protein
MSSEIEIDGIDFETEAATNSSSHLVIGRWTLSGVSSATNAFFAGGSSGNTSLYSIEKFNYFSEQVTSTTLTLSIAKGLMAGVSSPVRGYLGGGNYYRDNNMNLYIQFSKAVDMIDFSSETRSSNDTALSVGRHSMTGLQTANDGYFCGGSQDEYYYTKVGSTWVKQTKIYPPHTNIIDKLSFSTNTALMLTAVLNDDRSGGAGVQSTTIGYICSGYDYYSRYTKSDKLIFASGTMSTPITALTNQNTNPAPGLSSATRGYKLANGSYTSGNYNSISRLDFVTESDIALAAHLATPRDYLCGVYPTL